MRILIDILHPAHVHFFRNPIRLLREAGHEVAVTSRDKECTLELLDAYGIEHQCISRQSSGGAIGMARELLSRNRALARVAREFGAQVLTGIGGVCAAQVSRLIGARSVVFYDTEHARLQNALTYPFAHRIVVPECYTGRLPECKTVRYRGYHELSYLHPDYFRPSREIAEANGLAPHGDTFLVRLVSWKANHDIGQKGWPPELLQQVVDYLANRGRVVISAEGPLPSSLEPLRFSGDPGQIHHLMAYCRLCVGESATMASEAVVLGIPTVYAALTGRGYISEQQSRYRLARAVYKLNASAVLMEIEGLLEIEALEILSRYRDLIQDCIDVPRFVVNMLVDVGNSKHKVPAF